MHYNMINEVMNAKSSVINNIFVGMCATMFVGSDRYAMVVTEVLGPKKIRVAHLYDWENSVMTNEDGTQFMPEQFMAQFAKINESKTGFDSIGDIFTYRKNHRWMREGDSCWSTGSIHVGNADDYLDPCF